MIMNSGTRFFVSFSSRDLKFVREIMAALQGQGLDFWNYADIIQGIELGEKIDDRLIREIDRCSHMILVISENAMDPQIGRFCRHEMMYALEKNSLTTIHLIPVLLESHQNLQLEAPYDVFERTLCQKLDEKPESIVKFAVNICKIIGKLYLPPIEAHPSLPFWKLFRKEVEDMAHSNKEHVDLMMILGEFNEYYRKREMSWAHFLISYFIMSCAYNVRSYKPFYPLIVRAVCETELGMYDQAMKSYEEAKTINPHNQDAIGGIGTIFFRTGQYQKAADCFEQIINNHPDEDVTNASINLLITRLAMNEEISGTEADLLFNIDISGYPNDLKTAIMNARGVVLLKANKHFPLEKLCQEIIHDDLHDTITIRMLQLSFLHRGLIKEAEEVVRNAIKEAEINSRLDKKTLMGF